VLGLAGDRLYAGATRIGVLAPAILAATLFCFMLSQPLIGWISDKAGRKPLLVMAFGGGR
jgi:MFS family permease